MILIFRWYPAKGIFGGWHGLLKQTIAWNRNRRDFKDYAHEVDKTWLGARMTNEQLDILISRLSEFERLIFQEYILEDFTYRELSKQTGIPVTFLYKTIDSIKQKIRANVIRKTQ